MPAMWRQLAAVADPNIPVSLGWTNAAKSADNPEGIGRAMLPMTRAAWQNNWELVVALWRAGASLEGGRHPLTGSEAAGPLFSAAVHGSLGVLRLLIALGADIDARTDNFTAFQMACLENHVDCAEWGSAGRGVN